MDRLALGLGLVLQTGMTNFRVLNPHPFIVSFT